MQHFSAIRNLIFFSLLLNILFSCKKESSTEVTNTNGNIIFTFTHKVNGGSLKFDTLIYLTSLGNRYQVTDLQYFVSRVSLHPVAGAWYAILADSGIHYVDARDNHSCSWWVNDLINPGTYDSISFVFGLDKSQNRSNRFTDPPQRDMFWPDMMGGGYHYMKLNLKWKNDTMPQSLPFLFHLGIGQLYKGNSVSPDSIIGFVQNYFRVSIPCNLIISTGTYQQVMLQMSINRWFDGESAFNFAAYPNGIMQDETGMTQACLNGENAFSITIVQSTLKK